MMVGMVAAVAMSFAGPALAQDMTEEIQEEEQPGSEIELDIGGGEATIERKSGAPVFHPGEIPLGEGLRRCGRNNRSASDSANAVSGCLDQQASQCPRRVVASPAWTRESR
jgi:hypothetical protein